MDWYEILGLIRTNWLRVGANGVQNEPVPFTARDLTDTLGIERTEKSGATAIAAGWISTFRRWGYLKLAGELKSTGGRPAKKYQLTAWGIRFVRKNKKGKAPKG